LKFFSIIGIIIETIAQSYFLEGSIATIKEVAEKAGVSVSTVSHVVNGTRFVSEDLRNKVLLVLNSLDYQPNRLAMGLRKKSSSAIGLIVADITNPFFSEIAWRIENLCHQKNYSVMLCNTDGSPSKEDYYLSRLSEWQVDGIIVVSSTSPAAHLNTFNKPDMPLTLIDIDSPGYEMDSISVDNFGGGMLAAQHLASLGHSRIACISGSLETRYNQGRLNGFREGLMEAGLEVDEALIARADFNTFSGLNVTNQFLEMKNRPTAIFTCSDLLAYGAMKAAYVKGLKIPDDLSIVGFDDIFMSKYTLPPLTTVRQPISELTEEAVNCFLTRKEDPGKTSRTIKLKLHLEIRDSTAPPALSV
jgi:LacI family transcriptional regulator